MDVDRMRIELKNNVYMYIPCEECYVLKKKYILQVIAPQPEGSIGGSDTHVLQLAKEQKNSSAFAPIVLFKRNVEYEKRLLKNKIAYICGIYATDIEIAEALSMVEKYIDIVVIHSHQYDANFLTQTIKDNCKLLANMPTVMTCHGWIENNEFDIQETKRDFASYDYADALIAVCKKDTDRLFNDAKLKNKKIYCINNGVEIPILSKKNLHISKFKKMWQIPNQSKVIAYVGRLAYEKRIDLIIKTFKNLLNYCDDLYMLIVGNGEEYIKLKKMVNDYEISDKVIFTGFIENPYVVYTLIDFLILMSDTEGTPRCVLESMSCGKMAVATNVGGLNEIIDSEINGILINNNEVGCWTKVINDLLKNNELINKMNINARKKIEETFSIDEMCKKIENVYLDLGV